MTARHEETFQLLYGKVLNSYSMSMAILINLNYFCSFMTAFGVDAAFSYKYNQQHGICDKDGLAICPGFTTTHVIPVMLS